MQLILTPLGHLAMIEKADAASGAEQFCDDRIARAFAASPSAGIIALAGGRSSAAWPLSWLYWRDFGSRYLLQLYQTQPAADRPDPLPPPDAATLATLHLNLPPMPGAEYCTPDLLAATWRALDDWVRGAVGGNPDGLAGFLHQHAPLWGRWGGSASTWPRTNRTRNTPSPSWPPMSPVWGKTPAPSIWRGDRRPGRIRRGAGIHPRAVGGGWRLIEGRKKKAEN